MASFVSMMGSHSAFLFLSSACVLQISAYIYIYIFFFSSKNAFICLAHQPYHRHQRTLICSKRKQLINKTMMCCLKLLINRLCYYRVRMLSPRAEWNWAKTKPTEWSRTASTTMLFAARVVGSTFSRAGGSQIPFEVYEAAYEEEPEEDREWCSLSATTKLTCFYSCAHRWYYYLTFDFSSKSNSIACAALVDDVRLSGKHDWMRQRLVRDRQSRWHVCFLLRLAFPWTWQK